MTLVRNPFERVTARSALLTGFKCYRAPAEGGGRSW